MRAFMPFDVDFYALHGGEGAPITLNYYAAGYLILRNNLPYSYIVLSLNFRNTINLTLRKKLERSKK